MSGSDRDGGCMSENNDFGFDMKAEAPTLTLEPDLSAPIVSEEKDIQTTETAKAELAQKEQLSPEELKMVDDFAQKIDITNSQMILQYGAGTQKKVAEFSEKALETVKTKDIGEVGNMLASVVTELRTMDDSGKDSKGFLGLFKKKTNELAAYKARYEKAEVNIDRIASELEKHQVILLKDISMLDKMYEVNLAHFKELTLYIAAGKKKLEEARRVDLAKLTEKAKQTGLQEDTQAAKDFADMCNRFEKKIYDLELSKAVALQTAPQIRLIQSNDTVMTEKIQSTLVNTIPLWKSQMVIAIGLNHSQQAAKAQAAVSNATNEMLKKNAELLHTATIETAKESERGIIDIETLKSTNQTLISTLDEVLKIQEDGREKRKNAEIELQNIENTMRAKLLDMSRQQANINRQ
jgi:tellurite resistance protein